MTDFKPYVGRKRKSGTGCISEINDHLFEGRYSPKWPDGKKHARNVYAHTREECEEKLKVLIVEMNEERKNLKEQLAGIAPPEKLTKKQRKLWDYMRLHPEVMEFSTIAKTNRVGEEYGEEALWDGGGSAGEKMRAIFAVIHMIKRYNSYSLPVSLQNLTFEVQRTLFRGFDRMELSAFC